MCSFMFKSFMFFFILLLYFHVYCILGIPHKHSLISLFNNNCKYFDDIIIVSNPNFLTLVKQSHRKALTLNTANITSDF